jgi:ubiquinone/menaquinone biosynthesis C-methylase UbiE
MDSKNTHTWIDRWPDWEKESEGFVLSQLDSSLDALFDSQLKGYLTGEETVMDLGCGVGDFTMSLAPYSRKVVGVDVARATLEIARERAQNFGIKNVDFVHASGTDLLFADNSFDMMVSRLGPVSHFLDEAKRVLKRNGMVVEMTLGDDEFHELQTLLPATSAGMERKKSDRIKDRLDANGYELEFMLEWKKVVRFSSPGQLIGAIKQSGKIANLHPETDALLLDEISDRFNQAVVPITLHRVIWGGRNIK